MEETVLYHRREGKLRMEHGFAPSAAYLMK